MAHRPCAAPLPSRRARAALPQDCARAGGPAAAQAPAAPDQAVDLLIQGAVDTELQPLLAALEGKKEIQIGAWTFWRGRIGGKRVVVSRTEVGHANAAVATALGITTFHPELIINQGTAGRRRSHAQGVRHPGGRIDGRLRRVPVGARRRRRRRGPGALDAAAAPDPSGRERADGVHAFPRRRRMMKAALATPESPRPGREGRHRVGLRVQSRDRPARLDPEDLRRVHEDMESAFAAGGRRRDSRRRSWPSASSPTTSSPRPNSSGSPASTARRSWWIC